MCILIFKDETHLVLFGNEINLFPLSDYPSCKNRGDFNDFTKYPRRMVIVV